MFGNLNFIRNIYQKVTNQLSSVKKIDSLEQFYQIAKVGRINWVSIAINKFSYEGSFLTKELDIFTKNDAFSLKSAELKNEAITQLWKNQELVFKSKLLLNSEYIQEFNQLIDISIESEIRHFQLALNLALNNKSFTSTEISNGTKALEWIKVSFELLEKAIVKSLTDPELLFQTLFFFGENPKTSIHEIRIITFNLDIKFELLNSNGIRIKIFNDKSGAFGSDKKAALEGDFNYYAREMFDELIKLISAQSVGIKW